MVLFNAGVLLPSIRPFGLRSRLSENVCIYVRSCENLEKKTNPEWVWWCSHPISLSLSLVVNSYKYLGICFSTRLSFYHACQDLVSRAKRALLCIMSKLYRIDCNSINVFLCEDF